MNIYKPVISGSLTVTGSSTFIGSITLISGSITGTASLASTASSADVFLVRNNITSSNALVTGTLTAQTLVVQTITSSIEYSSGSNRFGNQTTDIQTFTGSINITGSQTIAGNIKVVDNPGVSYIGFGSGGTSLKYAYITSTNEGAQKVGLAIYTTSDAGTSNQERVRLNDSGNVGIGITNPSQPLHVYTTSTTTSTYFETNAANSYIGLKSTSGINYIGNVGYDLTFEAGGSEKVRILSGGNVGIGITNPGYKLEVRSSSTTSETIANFQNAINAINRYNVIRIGQPSYSAYVGVCLDTYDTAYFSVNSNPTSALGIYYSTANRLGINVRQPTNDLTLVASSTSTGKGLDFVNYASPAQVIGQLTFEQVGDFLELRHKIAGGGIKFTTYDTERMRITSAGAINIKDGTLTGGGGFEFTSEAYFGARFQSNAYKFMAGNNSTEYMRLTSDGNLLVNTTTDYSTGNIQVWGGIGVNGTISNLGTGTGTYTRSVWYNDGSNQILFENARTTDSSGGTGRTVYFTWRGGPSVGGGVQLQHGTNAWASYTSDARLKTKVADVENGVEAIMKLNPIKFKWTRELENSRTVTGFTAQNIGEAIPDAVFNSWQDEELGDVKSYYQDYLIPYLVKAIQEIKTDFEEYKETHP